MLTPKIFDEVNGNFLFSPKNFEEIRLQLLPLQPACCPPPPRASLAEPRRRGVGGQGWGRERGEDDEVEEEQEESSEANAHAALAAPHRAALAPCL